MIWCLFSPGWMKIKTATSALCTISQFIYLIKWLIVLPVHVTTKNYYLLFPPYNLTREIRIFIHCNSLVSSEWWRIVMTRQYFLKDDTNTNYLSRSILPCFSNVVIWKLSQVHVTQWKETHFYKQCIYRPDNPMCHTRRYYIHFNHQAPVVGYNPSLFHNVYDRYSEFQVGIIKLISPKTKWPLYFRRYFQMHHREWKILHFD